MFSQVFIILSLNRGGVTPNASWGRSHGQGRDVLSGGEREEWTTTPPSPWTTPPSPLDNTSLPQTTPPSLWTTPPPPPLDNTSLPPGQHLALPLDNTSLLPGQYLPPPWTTPPPPLDNTSLPPSTTPPPGLCAGWRYASYWNAFLLKKVSLDLCISR